VAIEGVWERAKDPSELLDYSVDFTELCVDTDDNENGEVIQSSVWTPDSPDLVVLQTVEAGKVSSAFFSGGIDGASYDVNVHVTTDEAGTARQHERTYRLIVRSR